MLNNLLLLCLAAFDRNWILILFLYWSDILKVWSCLLVCVWLRGLVHHQYLLSWVPLLALPALLRILLLRSLKTLLVFKTKIAWFLHNRVLLGRSVITEQNLLVSLFFISWILLFWLLLKKFRQVSFGQWCLLRLSHGYLSPLARLLLFLSQKAWQCPLLRLLR